MTAIDLFAGMGGATEGMQRAGLTVELAVDRDPAVVKAHREWHPNVPIVERDVTSITPDELAGRFVWASPSCKPWSTANRVRRGQDHPEYYPLARLAEQTRDAACVVIENVAGLVTERDGHTELERMRQALGTRPYSIHVLKSNEHGVPQLRRRAIIVIGPFVVWSEGIPIDPMPAVMATERTTNFRGTGSFTGGVRPEKRSIEEGARLQGVPVPQGVAERTAWRLIGNAVPPSLGESVCRQVLDSMRVAA